MAVLPALHCGDAGYLDRKTATAAALILRVKN